VTNHAEFRQRVAHVARLNNLCNEIGLVAEYVAVLFENGWTCPRFDQARSREFEDQCRSVVLARKGGEFQNAGVKNDSQGTASLGATLVLVVWLPRMQRLRVQSWSCRGFHGAPGRSRRPRFSAAWTNRRENGAVGIHLVPWIRHRRNATTVQTASTMPNGQAPCAKPYADPKRARAGEQQDEPRAAMFERVRDKHQRYSEQSEQRKRRHDHGPFVCDQIRSTRSPVAGAPIVAVDRERTACVKAAQRRRGALTRADAR
jgi:hypothetical protein